MLKTVSLWCALLFPVVTAAHANTLPGRFRVETVVDGPFVGAPVGFAFLPDGRIVIIEQVSGNVHLAAVGSAFSAVIHTIPGVRADHTERGLLGVTVDPDWPDRPFLYFYYTFAGGDNRVEMYTAAGDLDDPTSTSITLSDPYLLITGIRDDDGGHNGGTLRFGPDRRLYVATGEDRGGCVAQQSSSLLGKLLRLDVSSMPGTGTGPPAHDALAPCDNPLLHQGGPESLIIASGLRNPFRFTIDEPTGGVFVGDVGHTFFEEVNYIADPAARLVNFGWPEFEGPWVNQDCGDDSTFTFPIHVVRHAPSAPFSLIGGAIVRHDPGLPSSFPRDYDGDYVFFEFFTGVGSRLKESDGAWDYAPMEPGQADSASWCTGFGGVADTQLGPDGALYLCAMGLSPELEAGVHRVTVIDAPPFTAPSSPTRATALEFTAFPNPSAHGTTFRYETSSSAATARIFVYDTNGRRVSALQDSRTGSGPRCVVWDGRGPGGAPVSAGVYFARIETAAASDATRIVVLR